ncbi:MAG: AMP-binding protein, partial [Oscillospiraceae bacterium]|nr:AMP-binding protein [Oscillospiraceae bacterium]
CAYYIVDRAFSDGERIPIGRAFRNTELLLTEDGRPVTEPGRPGELWVRGTSLALGYYNAPEATARAFGSISAPYPERAYRTGDLAQYNARGELEFLGRRDAQIKHLGHRIELGEVELAANALPFIEAVCCVHDEARARLVMFYQSASPCDRELMRGLRETLPKYMLPNKLIHSVRLPENRNGKIDRAALRDAARK